MVSVSHTAHNIEITAESLQEDLARLEIQKQALERELAAVVAHLGSVQRALNALEALMHGVAQPQAADTPAAVSPKRPRPSASVPPQEGTLFGFSGRRHRHTWCPETAAGGESAGSAGLRLPDRSQRGQPHPRTAYQR